MAGLSQNGITRRPVTSTTDTDGGVSFSVTAGATAEDLIRAMLHDMDRLRQMVLDADVEIRFKPKGTDGA
jgi:hypothetical protein